MTCELTIVDCFGQTVVLGHGNWQGHLLRHAEIEPYHAALPTVLADPNLVYEMASGALHFYRLGLTQGQLVECYVKVIVAHFAETGWTIKTAYIMDEPRPIGTMRWMKRTSS